MAAPVRFKSDGNPEELPAEVRQSVWVGAAYLASHFQPLIQTIVDKGTAGFRKCPECNALIKWDGDPRVAEMGLNMMKDLMRLFAEKKPSGRELVPGDLRGLFEQMSDDDLEALKELAESAKSSRSKKAAPTRNGAAETQ